MRPTSRPKPLSADTPPRSRGGLLLRAAALFGGLVGLVLAAPGRAAPLPEYTGYTRPANVTLKESTLKRMHKEGKIRFAADAPDPNRPGKQIGGTVYFMVLDRHKGQTGDTFGARESGFSNLDSRFLASRDSPMNRLDTRARYLYLYQVVNDSGLDGWVYSGSVRLLIDPRLITSWGHFRYLDTDKVRKKVRGKEADEEKVSIQGVGFALERTRTEKGRLSATGIAAVGAEMEVHGPTGRGAYQPRAPRYLAKKPYSLKSIPLEPPTRPVAPIAAVTLLDTGRAPDKVLMVRTARFDVGVGGTELPRYYLPEKVSDERGRLAPGLTLRRSSYAQNALLRGVDDRPLFEEERWSDRGFRLDDRGSRLGDRSDRLEGVRGADRVLFPVIRAYWQNQPLRPGERSSIFGFTSDLPPAYDLTRITDRPWVVARTGAAAVSGSGIVGMADVRGGGVGPIGTAAPPSGTGSVPTPVALAAAETVPVSGEVGGVGGETAASGGGTQGGGFGGAPSGGGGLGGLPGGGSSGGGGIGGGAPFMAPRGGGGGGATGGGSGSGGGNPNTNPNTNPNGTQGSTTGTGQNQNQSGTPFSNNVQVNVNQSQQQQQQQKQQQQQQQQQQQSQSNPSNPGNVVPAPPAWLLGLLGLPVFYFIARRRRARQAMDLKDTASGR